MFSLRGKTAVVTGARSGIGGAIAVGFAAAGADLVLVGHKPDMPETLDRVGVHGVRVEVVAVDLADTDATTDAARQIARDYDVDILVNNAGTIRRGPVLEASYTEWREVLAVNLDAAFSLSQQLGQPMAARGSGKIINVASMLSFQGGIRVAGYTASKHAIVGLTKAMANELAPRGVQVNALAPGYIATDNTAPLRADPVRAPQIVDRIPAGRWGEPTDLVGAAIFLASKASDYVSGHVLAVDGGWLAR